MDEMDVGTPAEAAPSPGTDGASTGGLALAAIAVVVVGLLLATGALSPHLANVTPATPVGGPPLPAVNVTSAAFGGANASVSSPGCTPSCHIGLSEGATFTYTVNVTADCDVFGCATAVTSVVVEKPFLLISTTPNLPAAFAANRTSISLQLKAPSSPGDYGVNGTIIAGGLPAVVTLSQRSWGFTYSDATAGTFGTVPTNTTALTVEGGATFSLVIPVTASNGTAIQVSSFEPPTGFTTLSISPIGVVTVAKGATQNFTVAFRAPAHNWSGTFAGTIASVVLVALVVDGSVTITSNPFYEPNWSISPSNASGLTPGGTFFVYVTFQGGLDVSYTIAYTSFTASSPDIYLISETPSGTQTVNTNPVIFTLKFQLPTVGGGFQIHLSFTEA